MWLGRQAELAFLAERVLGLHGQQSPVLLVCLDK